MVGGLSGGPPGSLKHSILMVRAVTITKDGQPLIFNRSDLNTLGFVYAAGNMTADFRSSSVQILSDLTSTSTLARTLAVRPRGSSRLSPYGRVLRSNPVCCAETLKRNVYLHKNSGRVVSEWNLKQMAISDRIPVRLDLGVPMMHDGRASTSRRGAAGSSRDCRETQVRTVHPGPGVGFPVHIRLLKVDVEGS